MSNDRRNAALMHLGKPIVYLRGDAEIAELDQHVLACANAVFFRRAQCGLHIVRRKVEVAAQAQRWARTNPLPQALEQSQKILAVVKKTGLSRGAGRDMVRYALSVRP